MDVMIDIETLANTSNSAISQVAAIIFDRENGNIIDEFKRNVNLQTCIDIGLEMNVDTIEWWLSQTKKAQESILKKPRQSIKGVLTDLSTFIKKNWVILHNNKTLNDFQINDVKIWCHATFDEPVLSNAYNKCQIEEPWHFRGVRDLRTIIDLANYDIYKNENTGIAHDALDDCKFQIKYTVECIKQLTK